METLKKSIQCKFVALKRPNLVSLNQNIRPMVKKRMTMIFIALMAGSSLSAQEFKVDEPIPTHKWEIGIDFIPLFRPFTDFDFIVKRAIGDNGTAIRFRARPSYSNIKSTIYPDTDGSKRINTSISLGLEKRHRFGRFMFFYGSDLSFTYFLDSFVTGNSSLGTNRPNALFKYCIRETTVGVSGIIGGKCFLNHRISLSIESSLNINRSWVKGENGLVDLKLQPINVVSGGRSGNNVSFGGIAALFVNYHF